MENSEKVIVFMSTMGLESSYWGKPVIALYKTIYSYQNIVYQPVSENEMFDLIDDPNLPAKVQPKENWYKPAYYMMLNHATPLKHSPCLQKKYEIPLTHISGHMITTQSILGSTFLYMIVYKFLRYLSKYGIGGRFSDGYLKMTK